MCPFVDDLRTAAGISFLEVQQSLGLTISRDILYFSAVVLFSDGNKASSFKAKANMHNTSVFVSV